MIRVVKTDRSLIYDLLAISNPAPAEGPCDFKRRDKLLCLGGWNKRGIESGLIYADRSPDYYWKLLPKQLGLVHFTVEVHRCADHDDSCQPERKPAQAR